MTTQNEINGEGNPQQPTQSPLTSGNEQNAGSIEQERRIAVRRESDRHPNQLIQQQQAHDSEKEEKEKPAYTSELETGGEGPNKRIWNTPESAGPSS